VREGTNGNGQVVLFTPGEIAAANYGGYLTNQTITGWFAQNIKGAVVMVERKHFFEPVCETSS
jgi:hypothetical protein